MGFIRDNFGTISIESRRESFYVHAGYGYRPGRRKQEDAEGAFASHWRGPHPEFLYADLGDLIAALEDLRESRSAASSA